MTFANVMPWVLSAVGGIAVFLTLEKSPRGPMVLFFSQGLWLLWIFGTSDNYGMLPLTICYLLLSARGWYTWSVGERKE